MDTQEGHPRLLQTDLAILTPTSLPVLSTPSLPAIRDESRVSVVKAGEHLIACNGTSLQHWHRDDKSSWTSTIPWRDGDDETIEPVHMQVVDRTLVLVLNNGEVQLWKMTKSTWERQLRTTFAQLDVELAASNKRTMTEWACEHRYSIAAAIAVVVFAGTYYVHQKNASSTIKCADEVGQEATQVLSISSETSDEACPVVPPETTSEITPSVSLEDAKQGVAPLRDYDISAASSTDCRTMAVPDKPLTTLNDNALSSKAQNALAPDNLKDVTRKTAQDINKAVYARRHQKLGEQYAKDLRAATSARTRAEINNKIKSLNTQEFMDTVAMFSRKDGSEVLVVGNVKTRTDTAKDPGKIKYASDGYGWSRADKKAVVDTIRNTPEFRNARIKIIDAVDKATDAQQNAVRHAEMQFISHCKQAKLNHMEYVGGISKPTCIACDRVLSPNIRALGDGIVKDKAGLDRTPDRQARDTYSMRKPSRYAVKEQDWKEPSSVGPTHEVISSKKTVTHNVTKDKFYSAKPELTKPNIRKATLANPGETLARQTPKSIHKNMRKHINARGSLGSAIENIVENYDRPAHAEAKTLIHNKPSVYNTRSTLGAQASLHTARALAHSSVAHACAEGPNLSTGAHLGPSGASAYANAELCRAEAGVPGITAGVGLTAKTGISVGPAGLSLDILGFGFTLGPRMRVATPFADLAIGL